MVSLANSYLLYLLFLIPIVIGLFLLARIARIGKIKRYGNPEVLLSLMPEVSKYHPWVRLFLQLVAMAAIIFVLVRPRAGEKEENEQTEGIEVMIALDVSRSMLASSTDDSQGISRLDRAKYLLSRLIDRLDNDKVGLIVFAGEAYTQLPITTDFVSAKMYLDDINTEMVPSQGTAIGTAIGMALNSFSPDNNVGKAIIIITDGENHEGDAVEMAREANHLGVQVDVIGIGSTKGSPIPLNRSRGEFLKDSSGQPVTTALNEEMAKEIATAGGGVYITGSSSSALNNLTDQLDRLEKSEISQVVYKASAEQFPVFAWIAFGFLVLDIFILDRKNGWLKNVNFFTRG